jgi:hypothetical protein
MVTPTSTSGAGRSRRRRALIAALFLAAAILFAVYWIPTARTYYSGQSQFDLYQYYAGGHNWRAGFDPYKPLVDTPGALAIPRSETISGFIYPPAILPLLGQLSRLDYDSARAVWLTLSLVALLFPMALGVLLGRGRRWETAALGALLFAASNPVLFHLRQGQADMVVSGLAVTAFLLYGRWRSWPTAVLFALAVAVKLTPLVVVLALVAYRRDWPLLLKTLAVGCALAAVSLLFVNPHLYVEYVTVVLPEASGGNPFFHNQSLLRGWSHLDVWAKYASLAGYALIVAAAAVAGRGRRPAAVDEPGRLHLTSAMLQVLALAVAGVLLFSPLSWRMAFVWAVVPMTLVLAAAPWRGARWQYVLVACGAALMCLPIWDRPVLDSLETIGALLAGAGVLAALLSGTREPEVATPGDDQRRLSTQNT